MDGLDTFIGGPGSDILDGGAGTNGADYAPASGGLQFDLAVGTAVGADGTDRLIGVTQIYGTDQADTFAGGLADDLFFGRAGSDTASGGEGSDWLRGLEGTDQLDGGAGGDRLDGGDGNDSLAGGSGADEVKGSAGGDILSIRDQTSDSADCGDGADTATADVSDEAVGCEDVKLPNEINPPDTSITFGPPGRTVKRRVRFGFASTKEGSSYLCKLDRGSFRPCISPWRSPRLGIGPHTFSVVASDSGGQADQTPASRRFRVVRP